jgi:hypothetical protein
MRRYLVLGLFMSACGGDMTGIWLFEIEGFSGLECDVDVTSQNFRGAYVAEEAEDPIWQTEETEEVSPELVFGQIQTSGKDGWVLVLGDTAYPGTDNGDTWTFSWERSDDNTDLQSHQTGYTYDQQVNSRSVTTFSLSPMKESASGSVDSTTESWNYYSETDIWLEFVGFDEGRIPASTYLQVTEVGEDGIPIVAGASNTRESMDCEDEDCVLEVETSCSASRTVRATRYSFEGDGSFEALEDVQTPAGL